MRDPTAVKDSDSFSEAEVRRILHHAAEIEVALGNRVSAEEVRALAREAGIAEAAVDSAMRTIRRHPSGAVSASESSPPAALTHWVRRGLSGAFGFLGGAISWSLTPPVATDDLVSYPVESTVILAACSLLVAKGQPLRGRALFFVENAILWSAFTLGWSVMAGRLPAGMVSLCVGGALLTCGLGGLIIARRNRGLLMEAVETVASPSP